MKFEKKMFSNFHESQQKQVKKHKPIFSRDHPNITSAKEMGGWVQNIVVFDDVKSYIHAVLVGGSEKVLKRAEFRTNGL